MAKHRADSLAWFATHIDEMLVELINALVLFLRGALSSFCCFLVVAVCFVNDFSYVFTTAGLTLEDPTGLTMFKN